MLPLHALLSHAELTKASPATPEQVDGRSTPRRPRYGNITLYPLVHRPQPLEGELVDPVDEPTLAASISNISRHGVGLINDDDLPTGTQFDIRWSTDGGVRLMRFVVVHSRPTLDGMFRTGARLLAGELPEEPAPLVIEPRSSSEPPASLPAPAATSAAAPLAPTGEGGCETDGIAGRIGVTADADCFIDPGVIRIEPSPLPATVASHTLPPGTFQVSAASGFEKIERLDGVTTCGWERQIEMRRAGNRLWLYVHSPGKKNGWGIFVDPDQFQAAFARIQESATSPFLTTLAA